MKEITAIVSAYNEAPRIGEVLGVLAGYNGFKEIIVIDDGSTDDTSAQAAKWARKCNLKIVRNETNQGKGRAMDRGVELAGTEVIFFSDADITGLNQEMIDEIVSPVATGRMDMFIGMSDRKWYLVHQLLAFVPLLGGERAVTKELWQKVPEYYKQHFRIEVALNFFAIYYGRGYKYKILNGVTQTVKEEKYGFWEGIKARIKMFYNIFSAQLRLNFRHLPEDVMRGRWLAILAIFGAIGMIVGTMIFLSLYFGPTEFVRYIFAEDLRDPTADLAPILLELASLSSMEAIALTGLLIFVPGICLFILTRKNLSYILYSVVYKYKNGEPSS